MVVSKIFESRRTNCGSPTCLCITAGPCSQLRGWRRPFRLHHERRMVSHRNAGQEEHHSVPVLPRALRGCNVHNPDTPAHVVLLLQPDSSLRADFLDGVAGLHAAARFGREAHTRYMLECRICCALHSCLCGCRLTTLATLILLHAQCGVTHSKTPNKTSTDHTRLHREPVAAAADANTFKNAKIFIAGVTILLSLTVFLNLVAEKIPTTSDAVPLIGVTILLSLTVFLNLVAETLPQVSDAIPLLGTYFNCIMFMVASSVVLTVVVLNYHHRTADIHEMPQWIKTVFLQWLPWILGMSRPGKKITRKTILMNSRMKELELKERSSKSLLANVLDIDDDFRNLPGGNNASMTTSLGTAFMRHPTTIEEAAVPSSGTQRDLQNILRELQFITNRMKKADEEAEVISDWKFAAMVVDRFCLIIFTLFTIIATVAVLLSAPHIIVQ
ncbi:CHRNA7-FAM7A fusion protein isoform X17 [Onthophagus taurus]